MEDIKLKVKNFIKKLKTIKNIEIIIGIVIICIVALIYSTVTTSDKSTKAKDNSSNTSATNLNDLTEDRLAKILSEIDGAGMVRVMITYDIASSKSDEGNAANTSLGSGGFFGSGNDSGSQGSSELALPDVKGVIIVAEGARDIRVRLELMRAVKTVLNVDANAIEIFAMK